MPPEFRDIIPIAKQKIPLSRIRHGLVPVRCQDAPADSPRDGASFLGALNEEPLIVQPQISEQSVLRYILTRPAVEDEYRIYVENGGTSDYVAYVKQEVSVLQS